MVINIKFSGKVVGIPYARPSMLDRHEFVNLRVHPDAIDELPETKRSPELRDALLAVNTSHSRFMTLGCDFAVHVGNYPEENTHLAVSYIDLIFHDPREANSEDSYFVLIGRFFKWTKDRAFGEPLVVDFDFGPFGFTRQGIGGTYLSVVIQGFGIGEAAATSIWKVGLSTLRDFLVSESLAVIAT